MPVMEDVGSDIEGVGGRRVEQESGEGIIGKSM